MPEIIGLRRNVSVAGFRKTVNFRDYGVVIDL